MADCCGETDNDVLKKWIETQGTAYPDQTFSLSMTNKQFVTTWLTSASNTGVDNAKNFVSTFCTKLNDPQQNCTQHTDQQKQIIKALLTEFIGTKL